VVQLRPQRQRADRRQPHKCDDRPRPQGGGLPLHVDRRRLVEARQRSRDGGCAQRGRIDPARCVALAPRDAVADRLHPQRGSAGWHLHRRRSCRLRQRRKLGPLSAGQRDVRRVGI
jgi:hypothetical protein